MPEKRDQRLSDNVGRLTAFDKSAVGTSDSYKSSPNKIPGTKVNTVYQSSKSVTGRGGSLQNSKTNNRNSEFKTRVDVEDGNESEGTLEDVYVSPEGIEAPENDFGESPGRGALNYSSSPKRSPSKRTSQRTSRVSQELRNSVTPEQYRQIKSEVAEDIEKDFPDASPSEKKELTVRETENRLIEMQDRRSSPSSRRPPTRHEDEDELRSSKSHRKPTTRYEEPEEERRSSKSRHEEEDVRTHRSSKKPTARDEDVRNHRSSKKPTVRDEDVRSHRSSKKPTARDEEEEVKTHSRSRHESRSKKPTTRRYEEGEEERNEDLFNDEQEAEDNQEYFPRKSSKSRSKTSSLRPSATKAQRELLDDYASKFDEFLVSHNILKLGYIVNDQSKNIGENDKVMLYIKCIDYLGNIFFIMLNPGSVLNAEGSKIKEVRRIDKEFMYHNLLSRSMKIDISTCAGSDVCGVAFECGDGMCVMQKNDSNDLNETHFRVVNDRTSGNKILAETDRIFAYPMVNITDLMENVPETLKTILESNDNIQYRLASLRKGELDRFYNDYDVNKTKIENVVSKFGRLLEKNIEIIDEKRKELISTDALAEKIGTESTDEAVKLMTDRKVLSDYLRDRAFISDFLKSKMSKVLDDAHLKITESIDAAGDMYFYTYLFARAYFNEYPEFINGEDWGFPQKINDYTFEEIQNGDYFADREKEIDTVISEVRESLPEGKDLNEALENSQKYNDVLLTETEFKFKDVYVKRE